MEKLTVICPVYNEEHYISDVLNFFLSAQPPSKELILVDGGSSDRTVEIINRYISANPNIKLLSNPDKFVPYALNMAITASTGDPVVRLDAHTKYHKDYFVAILECFSRTGADIVGGPMRAQGTTPLQLAVAYATSTPLGVGDSGFHDATKEGFTESVYLGAWRRSIFETTGMFDTEMLRNQDDEFHYRARKAGFTVYLDPAIKSTYYPRNSIIKLFSQYFQYGLFKPLVLKKVHTGLRLRHLIPSAFVLYLASFPLAFINLWWFSPFCLYLLLICLFAVKSNLSITSRFLLFIIYPALHISYGSGFLKGLILLISGRKPSI
ncbi:MAG TPA: glycosyltransferase family 2 protein [Bacteroidia bacterium]|nr:glycosyltransferase family 2 protein [Bacteroidia bacterium]